MRDILGEIIDMIAAGETGALASVVSSKGSLPMSRRSKMLLLPDGVQRGTIGGGCLEAEVHAMASVAVRSGEPSLRRFTLTEADFGVEGLNCGGMVEILVEPVGACLAAEEADLLRSAAAALREREETVMATLVSEPEAASGTCRILGRGLIGSKGLKAATGLLGGSSAGGGSASFAVEEALAVLGQDRVGLVKVPSEVVGGGALLLFETLNASPTLYLFGGGHVSLAVARVASTAGFRIVVVDDRPAYANPERFPEAERTLVLPMETAVSQLPIDGDSYIVAVTRGHRHDEPVVEQAVGTSAAYIGMIGSRRKVAIMWERLRSRGITDDQLARVHAPIGLAIGADTPGEIAVSIVAQLVEARRLRR